MSFERSHFQIVPDNTGARLLSFYLGDGDVTRFSTYPVLAWSIEWSTEDDVTLSHPIVCDDDATHNTPWCIEQRLADCPPAWIFPGFAEFPTLEQATSYASERLQKAKRA